MSSPEMLPRLSRGEGLVGETLVYHCSAMDQRYPW